MLGSKMQNAIILFILFILIIGTFILFGLWNAQNSQLDESTLPDDEKEAKGKLNPKKRYKMPIIVMALTFIVLWVARAAFVAVPFMRDNMVDKYVTQLIVHTDNDEEKNTDQVFMPDEAKYNNNFKETEGIGKKEEEENNTQMTENIAEDYRKMLHMDLMEEPSYQIYEQILQQIYSKTPYKEDDLISALTPVERWKVRSNSARIKELQTLRDKRKLTEEESVEEYQLYQDTYNIYRTAEILFQSGRAAEDAFWAHYEGSNTNYERLLQLAAYSISAFEEFLAYEDRNVHIDDIQKKVQTNDLRLRNGKLYFRLRDFAASDEERLHFDLCSYGCFHNITAEADQFNEMSILGYYYLCHSIQNILSDDTELSGVEYQQLVDEGKEAVKKALALYREMDDGKNLITYKTEENVRDELKKFENIFERF